MVNTRALVRNIADITPRVPLAFAYLTPLEVCQALSAGLKRPVHYRRGPISLAVPVPVGYGDHLAALEETLGRRGAPYFGPDLEPDCTSLARQLWAGYRPLEEYASEAFPLEEAANGLRWMDVSADSATQQEQQLQKQVEELHVTPAGDDDDDDEGDLGAGFGGSC